MEGPVHGQVDVGFGPVHDSFRRNYEHYGEFGGATAVYVEGRKVVDLWGGAADRQAGRRWEQDTLSLVFSSSKGVLTICALHLAETGALDLDSPVTRYWPEFAAHGKQDILVRWLLSHRAGLALVDEGLRFDDVLSWTSMVRALERQGPNWPPNQAHAYHSLTLGWLVGEVIHRVSGLLPGEYFRTYIAEPLGLDSWIGLPETEQERVAHIEVVPESWSDPSVAAAIAASVAADDRALRANTLNGLIDLPIPGISRALGWNRPELHRAEIPAANLVTTARSLAKLYGATVGEVDGQRVLSAAAVAGAIVPQAEGVPLFGIAVSGCWQRWGTGFELPTLLGRPMLGPASFGHGGAGGQLAFADVDARAGFSFVTNTMGGAPDARAQSVADAVRGCLG
jgi:CubicO group peptidase (beta-lactamase class C family)